jgi:predicted dehydrogenase
MNGLAVGLAGAGRIAHLVHLDILTRLPDVRLVALAEPDPKRREEAMRRVPEAAAFADYEELLGVDSLEAVVICLPNALHAEAAIAALERRKHVYLEKPLARGLDEGQRVLAAWGKAGVVGMIGFNFRFNALYQEARTQLQAGALGAVIGARTAFSTTARQLPSWKRDREQGGGVLLDYASHLADVVHYVFDQEVREVSASFGPPGRELDTACLELRLSSGPVVQSFFTRDSVEEERLEIYGTAGKLTLDRHRALQVSIERDSGGPSRLQRTRRGLRSLFGAPYPRQKLRAPHSEPSYRAAIERFVAAARGNGSAAPDLWEGYRSLAVVAAAEESAAQGGIARPVDLAREDPRR